MKKEREKGENVVEKRRKVREKGRKGKEQEERERKEKIKKKRKSAEKGIIREKGGYRSRKRRVVRGGKISFSERGINIIF